MHLGHLAIWRGAYLQRVDQRPPEAFLVLQDVLDAALAGHVCFSGLGLVALLLLEVILGVLGRVDVQGWKIRWTSAGITYKTYYIVLSYNTQAYYVRASPPSGTKSD